MNILKMNFLTLCASLSISFFLFGEGAVHAQQKSLDVPSIKATASETPSVLGQDWSQLSEDPPPLQLARNSHFLVSNENHHDRFFPLLSKRQGDVYIGVGAEQNYLLSGWSLPDVMILMDFDQMVVDLHRVYRVLFLNAATKEDFIALWDGSSKTKKKVESLIKNEYGEKTGEDGKKQNVCMKTCQRVLKAFRISQIHGLVKRRLTLIHRQYERLGIPTFLTDKAQYQFLRERFQKKQVLLLRGDLSKRCLFRIAESMAKNHRVLGTLYLSNAERYFSYVPDFKPSMDALPLSRASVVLHTWALKNEGNQYAYFIQKADDFVALLKDAAITNLHSIIRLSLKDIRRGKYGKFPQPAVSIEQGLSSGSSRASVKTNPPTETTKTLQKQNH